MWKATYAESVERTDKDIAAVLNAIQQRGKPTIVILLADHGETLDDNELLHGAGFYESVVRVPLVIHGPGLEPGTSDALVSQVDLLPTIAEMVGVTPPEGIDTSLLPLMTEKNNVRSRFRSRRTYARSRPTARGRGFLPDPAGAVCARPLIQDHHPAPGEPLHENPIYTCLFNLDDDPKQLTNIATKQPAVVNTLRDRCLISDGAQARIAS